MPQPREYTVKSWSPWQDRETGDNIRDNHGNFKGSVLFEEDSAEPIDATFKKPPTPGDKKYGVVDLYTTRAGSVRKGYKAAIRPQQGYSDGGNYNQSPVPTGQVAQRAPFKADPDKQADIKAEFAIKTVVESQGMVDMAKVELMAKQVYLMVDRVKQSRPSDIMDGHPDPMNIVHQGEEYQGDPNDIPFD